MKGLVDDLDDEIESSKVDNATIQRMLCNIMQFHVAVKEWVFETLREKKQ